MLALHAGPFHPVETALVLLLALGPLIAAFVVVLAVRRREAQESSPELDSSAASVPPSS